jgi:Leucine-rich repeat (LRR) protein
MLFCIRQLFSYEKAANLITKLEDFDILPVLTTLHLRDNKLENLDGFTPSLKSLQYVNLRGNNISEYAQVKKFNALPKLRALVLLGWFFLGIILKSGHSDELEIGF